MSKELLSMLSSPGRSDQRPLVPKANHEHPSSSLFPLYEILDLAKETSTPMVQTTPSIQHTNITPYAKARSDIGSEAYAGYTHEPSAITRESGRMIKT
jgi:hypothetical protein